MPQIFRHTFRSVLEAQVHNPNQPFSPKYGDEEYISEKFEKLDLVMDFGILMVLILLFYDFLQLYMSRPIAVRIVGLLTYGTALDISSVICILMLMGIVTQNSILLVDFVVEKCRQEMVRYQALIQSGAERVRPILMTTIAMVAGMIPAVFASGAGAAFRAPMAIAVICCLTASTLLSLVFVPVVYSLMDDLREWLTPKLAKLTSVTLEDRIPRKEG